MVWPTHRAIQCFPFTLDHKTKGWVFFVEMDGNNLNLRMGSIELGYLTIKVIDHDEWGVKTINIDEAFRGQGLGEVLIYLFAALAEQRGVKKLGVYTPSGLGLWRNTGFFVEQSALPNRPPTIWGRPAKVKTEALKRVNPRYRIVHGIAPSTFVPPPAAPPTQVPGVNLLGSLNAGPSQGNAAITNDDL